MTIAESDEYPVAPCILAYTPRERAKNFVREALPRNIAKTVSVRSVAEFDTAIRKQLIDAVLVDIVNPTSETWEIASRSADFPSFPFFGLVQVKEEEAELITRGVQAGFVDILNESVDTEAARSIIEPQSYTARFARSLREPPPQLGLISEIQLKTWANIVELGGRPVTTSELAARAGVSREHLSRNFSQGNGPNLKRVIDLARLLSAADLAKNPGFDIRDVAAILGFASSSHLAVTTQRIASTRPASLSGLRSIDIIERFVQGRTRSRASDQNLP